MVYDKLYKFRDSFVNGAFSVLFSNLVQKRTKIYILFRIGY